VKEFWVEFKEELRRDFGVKKDVRTGEMVNGRVR